MSLSVCLHKLGKTFPPEEVTYIRQQYNQLRNSGLSPSVAADQLTARLLAEAQAELADVERQVAQIEASGDTERHTVQEPGHERDARRVSGRQRAARSPAPAEQGDLFRAAAVSGLDEAGTRDQLAADFAVRVENVETGSLRTGVDRIASPADAATLFRPYANKAQETLVVAVVDADGRVLEVLRHSIGGTSAASAYPHLIVGAVAANPQAAGLWVAHNHPSGDPTPSNADRQVTQPIQTLAEAAGLRFGGHVVLGQDAARVFAHEPGSDDYAERVDYTDLPRDKSIPVTEREITHRAADELPKIDNPAAALAEAQKAGTDGVLLLNAQHQVLGFLTLTPADMKALRTDGGQGARRVLAALHQSNAAAAIVVTQNQDAAATEAADNVGRMLNNTEVRPLDHIALAGLKSAAERGAYPPSGTQFYARPHSAIARLRELRTFLEGASVANLTGKEFLADGIPLTQKVPAWYQTHYAGKVAVPGVGDVLLDARAVKSSLAHGIGRNKAAAFAAVPDILTKGKLLQKESLRGAPQGDMLTYGAPIDIDGKAYVAVVLVKSDANTKRMYVHEVVLKERLQAAAFKTGAPAEAGERTGVGPGAIRSVLQRIYSVNADDAPHSSPGDEANSDRLRRAVEQGYITDLDSVTETGNGNASLDDFLKRLDSGELNGAAGPAARSHADSVLRELQRVSPDADAHGAGRARPSTDNERVAAAQDMGQGVSARSSGGGAATTVPLVLYHGTDADITAFDTSHGRRLDAGWLGRGVYVITDAGMAGEYARRKAGGTRSSPGQNVLPLMVRASNLFRADDRIKAAFKHASQELIDAWTRYLQGRGYDGVRMAFPDGHSEVCVFNPARVRSVSAQFDPAKQQENNLLYRRGDDHHYLSTGDDQGAPTAPLSAQALDDIIAGMRQAGAWSDAVEIRPLANWRQLPFAARMQVMADGAYDAKGLYRDGVIYLFRDNLTGPADALATLLHESRHNGLDWLLGERKAAVMQSICRDNADVRATADALMATFPDLDVTTATEEALADRKDAAAWQQLKGWRKLVSAVKATLRRAFPGLSWTDNDVLHLLHQAATALQQDRAGASRRRQARYSRATDPLVRFWKSLAAWDDAFKYPRSDAPELPAILSEIDPAIQAEPSPKLRETMRHTYPALQTLWSVKMPADDPSPVLKQQTPGYETAYVYATDTEVWLDVSELQPGLGGGSKLYAAVAQYALNTGKVFIGDPAGLSALGWIRRLENMVSAALKTGTTRHLQPHPDMVTIAQSQLPPQLKRAVPGLDWRAGDDEHNLRELLLASYAMTKALAPEVQDVTYDPGTGQFRSAGQELSDGDFLDIGDRAAGALERAGLGNLLSEVVDRQGQTQVRAPLGSATLKRAAISHSLVSERPPALDGQGGQRNGLLDAARRWLSGSGVSPTEHKILYSRPQPADITPASGTYGDHIPVPPAPTRAAGNPPGLDWALQPETHLDGLTTQVSNYFHRATQLGEAIRAAGGQVDLDAGTDIDSTERLHHGKVTNDVRIFGQDVVTPLLAKIKALGLTAEDVGAYLYARHAPERNAYIQSINPNNAAGSGLNNSQATQVIIGLDRQGKLAKLRTLDADIAALRELQLRELEKAGEVDNDTLQRWRTTYRHYVPLKGWATDGNEAKPRDILSGQPLPKGYSASASMVKRALGRSSLADNPLLLLIHDTEKALVNTRKNEVRQVLLNLVRRYPNPDVWEELKQPPMRAVLVNDQVQYVPDHLGARRREDIMLVKEHGRLIYVQLHDAGLATALKRLNVEGLEAGWRVANKLTTWWKMTVTSLSPAFQVANLVADNLLLPIATLAERDGGVLQGDKTGPGRDWWQREMGGKLALPKRIAQVVRLVTLVSAQRFADDSARMAGVLERASPSAQRWLALYDEMRAHGGEIGFMGLHDLDSRRAELGAELGSSDWRTNPGQAFRNSVHAIERTIEKLSAGVENATRLIVYAMAREAYGVSPEKAALFARTVTVDFNRRGSQRKLDVLFPFFNAGVRGIERLRTLIYRGKGQLAKRAIAALAALAVSGATVAWWNDMVCDRAPQGQDASSHRANAYETTVRSGDAARMIHVAMPFQGNEGQVLATLRLPHELSPFWNAGTAFYEAVFNDRPDYAGALLLSSLGSALNPLSGAQVSDSFASTVLGTVMPLQVRPLWELNQNQDSFGTPIHKQDYDNDVSPASTRGRTSTGEGYKDLASGLNAASGGDGVHPGLVDAHPESIRHLVHFAGGSVLTFWQQVMEGTQALFTPGQTVPTSRLPLANRFVREHDQRADQALFYRYGDKVAQANGYRENAKKDGVTYAPQDGYEAVLSRGPLKAQFKTARKQLKTLEEQRAQAMENLSGAALAAQQTALDQQERAIYVRFNELVGTNLANYTVGGKAVPLRPWGAE